MAQKGRANALPQFFSQEPVAEQRGLCGLLGRAEPSGRRTMGPVAAGEFAAKLKSDDFFPKRPYDVFFAFFLS